MKAICMWLNILNECEVYNYMPDVEGDPLAGVQSF